MQLDGTIAQVALVAVVAERVPAERKRRDLIQAHAHRRVLAKGVVPNDQATRLGAGAGDIYATLVVRPHHGTLDQDAGSTPAEGFKVDPVL